MTWAEGYPAGTGYTHGYYRQLNPVYARSLLTVAGFAVGRMEAACELGYGQGVSIALHAAGSGAAWWGTDFMPDQAEYASLLAGPGAVLDEAGFAEFCARPDLPQFDFVGAHGIWSWVSPENRAVIVDFLRRKLRPGGIFYVSHNTETGWAGLRPFRELLRLHVRTRSAAGCNPHEAVRAATAFMGRVFAAQSVYARQNPMASAMLEKLASDDTTYPMHEFLGDHWHPASFADVAAELAGAKLAYACSAAAIHHVPGLALLQRQQEALAQITDTSARETALELLRGTRFRRDYWIKGGLRLTPAERAEAVGALRWVLVEPRAAVTEVRPATHAGDVNLPMEAFDPLLDLMADYRPHRLDALTAALSARGLSRDDVLHSLLVLTEVGAVQPAHADDDAIKAVSPRVSSLNDRLMQRAQHDLQVAHLASPVTGGATDVPHAQQLLLMAERAGVPVEAQAGQVAARSGMAEAALEAAAARLASGRREVLRVQGVA